MISLQFLLTSLVVILVPGTGVIYTVSTGLTRGGRIAVVAALGCTLGIVPHLLAAVFGLSAILHMGSAIYRILKIAGIGYLLYLAWSMWRATGTLSLDSDAGTGGMGRVIIRAILLNLLNPKLTLFFFAFLPQFLPGNLSSGAGATVELVSLGGLFMLMTFVVFIGYGLLAASVRRLIDERPRVLSGIQKTFAGILAALAIRLAVAADE